MKKPSKNIDALLEQHFKDDRENFSKIEARNQRFETLLGQMGEHLSFLRRDMNVITTTQQGHAQDSSIFRGEMKASIEKIEKALTPIEKERSDEIVIDERNKKRAEQVIFVTKVIVGVGAACTTVWAVFKYVILQAIK